MPPASRRLPTSGRSLSVIWSTVPLRSWNTRWLSCSRASPAAVMRTRRPTRRKTGSLSSRSSDQDLAADGRLRDAQALAGGSVNDPVSAMARMISS